MYDQSPVPERTRGPRFADADRILVGIGVRWNPAASASLDFGYARLFSPDARVTQDGGNRASSGKLVGLQESGANIFSTQFTYRFE